MTRGRQFPYSDRYLGRKKQEEHRARWYWIVYMFGMHYGEEESSER
jgi:hypothetical protein